MAGTTREKLVLTAHGLFYQSGFHAVGLDQVLEQVGVSKTTFYNHFESKEELVLEVLRWHDKWWRETFAAMLREHGGDTARGQLLGVFDALEVMFQSAEFNGCIFINVSVEFPLLHDPAHIAAAQHKQAMGEIIREIAAYAGADDPKALSEELSMVMEGAYVTRQITGRPETAEVGRRLAQSIIERRLPIPANR